MVLSPIKKDSNANDNKTRPLYFSLEKGAGKSILTLCFFGSLARPVSRSLVVAFLWLISCYQTVRKTMRPQEMLLNVDRRTFISKRMEDQLQAAIDHWPLGMRLHR